MLLLKCLKKDLVTYVAGGCGIVGSGIVGSLLQNGAKCWVSSRDTARLDELKKSIPSEFHSNLGLLKADVSKGLVDFKHFRII